jgi:hypothetical protein
MGMNNPETAKELTPRLAQLKEEITAQKRVIQQLFATKKFGGMPAAQHQLARLQREYNVLCKKL